MRQHPLPPQWGHGNNFDHHESLDPWLVLGPQLLYIEPEGIAWQLSASFNEDDQIGHEGPQVEYTTFLVFGDLTIQPGSTVGEELLTHGPVHVTVPQPLGPEPLSHPPQR